MNKKGLSQVLTLIVAASVLMMTALTIIFMVQGGLGDFGQSTDTRSCTGAIDSICATTNTEVTVPRSCVDGEVGSRDARVIPGVSPEGINPQEGTVNCGVRG